MKTPGLIERFRQVAAVQTRERNALCPNTQSTYIHWLRLFWRFMAPKAAREWTGHDVESFMWYLKQERYADKSRRQALCALVYVFKNVLKLDPGTLNLPAMPKEKPRVKIIPSREELAREAARQVFGGRPKRAGVPALPSEAEESPMDAAEAARLWKEQFGKP